MEKIVETIKKGLDPLKEFAPKEEEKATEEESRH